MRRAALVLALVAVPAVAHANGRFPQTVDVHFKPGDNQVLALAMSWGLITSTDGGDTWHWSCEEAVGFGGVYDPDYAFTPTGLLLATTTSTDGLRLTRDRCTWTPAPPPLGSGSSTTPSTFVAQVEVASDGVIYAAASTATDSHLYVSSDDGVSFQMLPTLPGGAHADWWESMLVAPSTSGATTRLYLTGYNLLSGGTKQRLFYRSDDAGASWAPLPLDAFTFGGNNADLQVIAVAPDDPSLVFARVLHANGTTAGDDIYRSDDAGQTWAAVYRSSLNVTAVLVRKAVNGQPNEVDIAERPGPPGLPDPGPVHVSTDGGKTFDAGTTGKEIDCLRERADGTLFACGNSFPTDNMALGTGSIASWTPLVDFAQVDGPVACPAGTVEHDVCDVQRWPSIVCQFGITDPNVNCGTIDAGPVDGGHVNPKQPGCCSTGASPEGPLVLAALVALPLVRRRRRLA